MSIKSQDRETLGIVAFRCGKASHLLNCVFADDSTGRPVVEASTRATCHGVEPRRPWPGSVAPGSRAQVPPSVPEAAARD